jgi:5-methyltetrahydrofolate--homocysteine methyltransferase
LSAHLVQETDLTGLLEDLLSRRIHRQYLEAGADIVETNTFGASPVGIQEFGFSAEVAREINFAAVECARRAVEEYNERTPDKPRFIAGSIGPTTKQMAISTSTESAATRA